MSLDIKNSPQDVYIREFYEALDCPRSLTCWLLYKYNEHKQLTDLAFEVSDYPNFSKGRDALAATKFLAKATFLKTNVDLKAVALKGFHTAEQVCEDTNDRLKVFRFQNPYTLSILTNMAGKIKKILGRIDPEEFVDSCGWGPGASLLIKRRFASQPKKFDVERQITPRAYNFVKGWFHAVYPNWEMTFEIVHSSKVVTVAKNAKTDRVIAIEPGINLWFQKGIGSMIRRRLKAIGIDLNDQTHNQRLSRLGSLFGDLATVDYSAASDTIAYELVKLLLPEEWFNLLNSFKVDYSSVDGNVIKLNKFSSMGNGFTFELESLIFYALAEATCYQLGLENPTISVYGDDVILPSKAFDLFDSVSKDLGFSVNVSKSYSSGPFRESCGAYYWGGKDVKPVFQKEPLHDMSSKLKAANNIRRYANRRNSYGCDRSFRNCWLSVVRSCGTRVPSIGDGYGDLGLVVNPDERDKDPSVTRAKHGYEGYYTRVWALMASQRDFDSLGLLLYKLKSTETLRDFDPLGRLESVPGGNSIPLSGRFKHKRMRMFIPLWPDLGPWV